LRAESLTYLADADLKAISGTKCGSPGSVLRLCIPLKTPPQSPRTTNNGEKLLPSVEVSRT